MFLISESYSYVNSLFLKTNNKIPYSFNSSYSYSINFMFLIIISKQFL